MSANHLRAAVVSAMRGDGSMKPRLCFDRAGLGKGEEKGDRRLRQFDRFKEMRKREIDDND